MSWYDDPALFAATITGTVTFTIGILSQLLAHSFTKRRENEKSFKEAFSQLHSPLSIEIYKYLIEYGKLPEAKKARKSEEKVKRIEEALNGMWENITKIIENNKQYVTLGLSHNFRQTTRNLGDDFDFFYNFFKEYKKRAKKVGFKEKLHGNTPKDLLHILELYNIIYSRYGDNVALYIFRVMDTYHKIPLRKTIKKLNKEKYSRREYKRIPFDIEFENLVLNKIKPLHCENWKTLIQSELNLRKQRANQMHDDKQQGA